MRRSRIIDPAAQAAIDTTSRGYYEKNQRRIPLKGQQAHKFSDVEVFDPTKLKAIQDDADEYFDRFYLSSTPCSLYLMDADSLQAAEGLYNPLVLNFANARHPGGGFLNGAQAQEESLCRCSTLYASIASRKAQEMYRFNKEHPSATDSDYMLLSPGVCVFQAQTGELLDEPFCVSVWTMPAPDKYGRAVDVPQAQMDMIMKERLRKFFLAAAKRGYRNLVLGAWGCGAFGHNTKVVAGYFYDLLFGEKYIEFFDTIVFAILHSPDKIRDFAEVFGDKIENCSSNAISADRAQFLEAVVSTPVCNHTAEIGAENIGYTQGILSDGTPFEAELWADGPNRMLQIILPELDFSEDAPAPKEENIVGFQTQATPRDWSVLAIGMVDRGYSDDIDEMDGYLNLLVSEGVLRFTGPMRNSGLHRLTDSEGKDLAGIIVSLSIEAEIAAETYLKFHPFPGRSRKNLFTIL